HEVDDAFEPRRLEPVAQFEHLVEGGDLDEERAVSHRQDPDCGFLAAERHHGARTSTPASSSAARTVRAIAIEPGESPCTHSDAAPTATTSPSTDSTTRS